MSPDVTVYSAKTCLRPASCTQQLLPKSPTAPQARAQTCVLFPFDSLTRHPAKKKRALKGLMETRQARQIKVAAAPGASPPHEYSPGLMRSGAVSRLLAEGFLGSPLRRYLALPLRFDAPLTRVGGGGGARVAGGFHFCFFYVSALPRSVGGSSERTQSSRHQFGTAL